MCVKCGYSPVQIERDAKQQPWAASGPAPGAVAERVRARPPGLAPAATAVLPAGRRGGQAEPEEPRLVDRRIVVGPGVGR